MYTSLDTVKQHLNIDLEFNADDELLYLYIQAAEDSIAKAINVNDLSKLVDKNNGYLPASLQSAILLMVGNLYANREPINYGSVVKIPYTLDFLIALNKSYKAPF